MEIFERIEITDHEIASALAAARRLRAEAAAALLARVAGAASPEGGNASGAARA